MLVNLSTLDILSGTDQVVQAWSPEYNAWVCVVDTKSEPQFPGVIELTRDDIRRIAQLRLEGQTKQQALAAVGVSGALPPHSSV